MPRYKFSRGSRIAGLDPVTVGEHIETIKTKRGGTLTPADVLKDAKRKASPLHDYFDWSNTSAAEKYRLIQAGHLVRSVVVVFESAEITEEDTIVRAFVSLADVNDKPAYVSVSDAMADPESRREIVRRAMREASAWQKRYQDLAELAHIFAAINDTEAA